MSTTLTEPDASVRANLIQTEGKGSTAVNARGVAPMVISLGLVGTLAWNGLLVWMIGRMIDLW
jgi:hypothetical protein